MNKIKWINEFESLFKKAWEHIDQQQAMWMFLFDSLYGEINNATIDSKVVSIREWVEWMKKQKSIPKDSKEWIHSLLFDLQVAGWGKFSLDKKMKQEKWFFSI